MFNWRPGVLNKKQMIELCEKDIILNANVETIEDPSSIDLHIEDALYQLQGCVKPQKKHDIPSLGSAYKKCEISFDSDDKILLEKSKTYLFRVKETIDFKDTPFCGQATGKSTFGRLDILTRLMTTHNDSYDNVEMKYAGSLWVEITPITFSVIIKRGMSLNQLRVFKGDPLACRIEKKDLFLWGDLILDENGTPLTDKTSLHNLTLNLNEDPKLGNNICAYAVRKEFRNNCPDPLDLTHDFKDEGYIDSEKYWDKLPPTNDNPLALEIEPELFYILRSRERFKLPNSVAIYCQAVTENLGELRIHYAGFAHPCFGDLRPDDKGAPLIFEVRGHNIITILQHGETLARLDYHFMSENADPKDCSSSYHKQELNLSKFFK